MEQICRGGECEIVVVPRPDAGPGEEDAGGPGDAGVAMDSGVEDPEDRVFATGGCVCEAAGPRGTVRALQVRGILLALALLGLLVWRRRRAS
jgi:MYXO-CTERM domain-containing protein